MPTTMLARASIRKPSTRPVIEWTDKARAIQAELDNNTGDLEGRTRHPFSRMIYTVGVHELAEKCGAYWLIDAIGSHQPQARKLMGDGHQFWYLIVHPDRSALLAMAYDSADDDSGEPIKNEQGERGWAITQAIEYTDFPLPIARIWVADNTAYLPSEH